MRGRTGVVLLGALIFVVVLIGVLIFPEEISAAGRFIPQNDIITDYIIGAIWAAAIGLGIMALPLTAQNRELLMQGWVAKCFMTLLIMLPYEYYYDTDAFGYFYGSLPSDYPWGRPQLGQGTANILALAWAHGRILPQSYHAMKVTFALTGLLALFLCYKAAMRLSNRENPQLFLALALFPSNLFWSSIIGKDPIILLAISVYLFGVTSWYRDGGLKNILLVIAGVLGAMYIRIWMGPILLAPFGCLLVFRFRHPVAKLALLSTIGGMLTFAIGETRERFNIETRQDIYSSADALAHGSGWAGGSEREVEASLASPGRILTFLPVGIVTALFRPFPGEIPSAFGFMAGLENLFLLLLLVRAIRRTRFREMLDPPILWATLLLILWASVYGVVSYRNLGAAVRFRLQVLPVMLCLMLFLGRKRGLHIASQGVLARELPPPPDRRGS